MDPDCTNVDGHYPEHPSYRGLVSLYLCDCAAISNTQDSKKGKTDRIGMILVVYIYNI